MEVLCLECYFYLHRSQGSPGFSRFGRLRVAGEETQWTASSACPRVVMTDSCLYLLLRISLSPTNVNIPPSQGYFLTSQTNLRSGCWFEIIWKIKTLISNTKELKNKIDYLHTTSGAHVTWKQNNEVWQEGVISSCSLFHAGSDLYGRKKRKAFKHAIEYA